MRTNWDRMRGLRAMVDLRGNRRTEAWNTMDNADEQTFALLDAEHRDDLLTSAQQTAPEDGWKGWAASMARSGSGTGAFRPVKRCDVASIRR
jgi:hypothetical protein